MSAKHKKSNIPERPKSRADTNRTGYRGKKNKVYEPYIFRRDIESKEFSENMLSLVTAHDMAKAASEIYNRSVANIEKRAKRVKVRKVPKILDVAIKRIINIDFSE